MTIPDWLMEDQAKQRSGMFSLQNVQLYEDGVNCNWTQDFACIALRWDRRLEFALEGSRFYDLVRWGIAAETLNEYFEVESTRRVYLREAFFQMNICRYLSRK